MKMKKRFLTLVVAVLVATAFLAVASQRASGVSGTYIPDIIHVSSSTVWNGEISVTRYTVVDPGVTLTISPGATVMMRNEYLFNWSSMGCAQLDSAAGDQAFSEYVCIEVRGNILAQGTATHPIMFRNYYSVSAFDQPHDNQANVLGLYLHSVSVTAPIEYCVFDRVQRGIYSYDSTAKLDHCVFMLNSYAFTGDLASVTVQNCEFSSYMDFGFYTYRGWYLLDGNDFLPSREYSQSATAVIASGNPDMRIVNNRFMLDEPSVMSQCSPYPECKMEDMSHYSFLIALDATTVDIDATGNVIDDPFFTNPEDRVFDHDDNPKLGNVLF